jgi:hypothetical protein
MSGSTQLFDLCFDHRTTPNSSVLFRFMARVGTDFPHGVSVRSSVRLTPQDLLPKGSVISATWQSIDGFEVLAESEGSAVYVDVGNWGTFVRVAGATTEIAQEIGEWLRGRLDSADADRVDVLIWNSSSSGGSYEKRTLSARRWANSRRNYPLRTQDSLDSLMRHATPEHEEGGLILFHGEPGTGKTNAIRTLMTQWAPWCDFHLVTDPDRLFADARYLLDVVQKSAETLCAPTLTSVPEQSRWKLVIAEDTDAQLVAGSAHDGGAPLGRLLNATDGLLAQSSQVLVLLTTNTAPRHLHPAITRPGRCLSKVEFTRFDAVETRTWLGEDASLFSGSATLAELYQLRQTGKSPTADFVTGMYL